DGVVLSGAILDANGIGGYVNASGARLCVLNTCASEELAFLIIAGGKADMIFTISADIKDPDALRFGTQLSADLAETEDFEEAFNKAKGPGTTKYRFLNATAALRGLTLTAADRLQSKVEEVNDGQYSMKAEMKILNARVDLLTAQTTQNQQSIATNQQQAMQSQQQALLTQGSTGQIADLDRNMAQRRFSTTPSSTFTPTFWALLVLVSLLLLAAVFFVGRFM